jgi:CRP-like cAMP-binding protein
VLASRCYQELAQPERAVGVLHACAQGLLRRDFLLSATAALKQALQILPEDKRVLDTLLEIHARAVRTASGRAAVPPPLPPQPVGLSGAEDLTALEGQALSDRAAEILLQPDPTRIAEAKVRPPLPLFADLAPEPFLELVRGMRFAEVEAQTVLSSAGNDPKAMFVLVAGKAEVTVREDEHDQTMGFLSGGSIFGEVALLTGSVPTATVTAAVPCELFEVRKEVLRSLVVAHPPVADTLATFGQQRLARSLLGRSSLFRSLSAPERLTLLESFEYRPFEAGEVFVHEGEPSPGLLIILSGEFAVNKSGADGQLLRVGAQREGDICGEISMLREIPATATVTALRRSAAAFMPRSEFRAQLSRFPKMKELLEQLSRNRLAHMGEMLRPAEILDADELVVEAEL